MLLLDLWLILLKVKKTNQCDLDTKLKKLKKDVAMVQ